MSMASGEHHALSFRRNPASSASTKPPSWSVWSITPAFSTRAPIQRLPQKKGKVWSDHANVLDAAMHSSERWRSGEEAGLSEAALTNSFNIPVKMKVFAWTPTHEKDTVMTPLDSIKYHRQMLETGFMVMDP